MPSRQRSREEIRGGLPHAQPSLVTIFNVGLSVLRKQTLVVFLDAEGRGKRGTFIMEFLSGVPGDVSLSGSRQRPAVGRAVPCPRRPGAAGGSPSGLNEKCDAEDGSGEGRVINLFQTEPCTAHADRCTSCTAQPACTTHARELAISAICHEAIQPGPLASRQPGPSKGPSLAPGAPLRSARGKALAI